MRWNYRILRSEDQFGVNHAIHEVYYDEDEAPVLYSAKPAFPEGETVKELEQALMRYIGALGLPVLTANDFPAENQPRTFRGLLDTVTEEAHRTRERKSQN